MKKSLARPLLILLVTCLSFGADPTVRGDSIYSNFGPGNGYDPDSAVGFGTSQPDFDDTSYGVPFTPGSTFALDSILLPLGLIDGANVFDVLIVQDSNGLPGSPIEILHLADAMPDILSPTLVLVPSVIHPLLESNLQYWIVLEAADPSTFAGWFLTSSDSVGLWAESDGGQPFYLVSDVLPAIQVLGTRAVPEPSSLVMLGLGAIGLATARIRRLRISC